MAAVSHLHRRLICWLLAGLAFLAHPLPAQTPNVFVTATQSANGVIRTALRNSSAHVATAGVLGQPRYHPSSVIVRFKGEPEFLRGSAKPRVLSAALHLHRVDNPPGHSVAEVIRRYRANPHVAYVEPDYAVSTDMTPNDPSYSAQRDMAAIAAPQAWDLHQDSSGVVVAVVDTGIDYTHPDLQANLYTDPVTPSTHGYTCLDGSCAPGGTDDFGHGTHVAGTIGAVGNNGRGIAGLNWRTRLLSVKVLDATGSGQISDAVLAYDLLLTLKQRGANIRVTNNSWGGGGYSQALFDAMEALAQAPEHHSTLNVCAAGNYAQNTDMMPFYPASYESRSIISVLASDNADNGANFSDFGLASVDIAAPGVDIYSTAASGSCQLCDPSGYRLLSGTSMATPHVAGVAAALLAMNPNLSAAQARDALLHPDGYDALTDTKARMTATGGRLNFYKAITNSRFLTNPVLNQFPLLTLSANITTARGGTVNFTWSASDADGDPLRVQTGRNTDYTFVMGWLFGIQTHLVFPETLPFTALNVGHTTIVRYDISAADNRGGGTTRQRYATIASSAPGSRAPAGLLSVPRAGAVAEPIPVKFTLTDPGAGSVVWDVRVSVSGSASWGGFGSCCFSGDTHSVTFDEPGVYRVSVQAIDGELNTSEDYSAVISIGGAAGVPPIAKATLDKDNGPVPLAVQVDMSQSSAPGGSIAAYYVACGDAIAHLEPEPVANCTFFQPGIYWLAVFVEDDLGNMTKTVKYVVATPSLRIYLHGFE